VIFIFVFIYLFFWVSSRPFFSVEAARFVSSRKKKKANLKKRRQKKRRTKKRSKKNKKKKARKNPKKKMSGDATNVGHLLNFGDLRPRTGPVEYFAAAARFATGTLNARVWLLCAVLAAITLISLSLVASDHVHAKDAPSL
jgi:Flp pilus assembly protein TadB